jgi:beta-glucosidase
MQIGITLRRAIILKPAPVILYFLVGAFWLAGCSQPKLPYQDTSLTFEERAADLVSRMTMEEKVSQMLDEAPAIERLGVTEYNWWNECLHGVGRAGLATVFPQAIGMAAMWDGDQMLQVATAISDEARAKHSDFEAKGERGRYQGLTFWTPNINIFRDPRWGRGMETYGEDPYLVGELAVNFIKGLQGNDEKYLKVVATAKHFVVHSGPEPDRHKFNATPSDYDLVETYLPHFKRTVEEAHVYSVMCAYNRLNGQPCCGSEFLDKLLRVDWGFQGYVVSDCGAIRDFYNPGDHEVAADAAEASAMAVKGGTDLNCGNSYKGLIEALNKGLISEAEIDLSVKRLMLARMKLGMFDPPAMVPYNSIPYSVVDSRENAELALKTAQKSIVLLKNENQILPLDKQMLKKVAVIGPNANNEAVLLGNYNGFPSDPKTLFSGIAEKLPMAEVNYALGTSWAEGYPYLEPVASQYLFTDESLSQNGLKSEYFNRQDFTGDPDFTGVDASLNFVWWDKEPKPGIDNKLFSARWTGVLVPPVTGNYQLGGDGFPDYAFYLNDSLVAGRSQVHHPGTKYKGVYLEAGRSYNVRFEFHQHHMMRPMANIRWEIPGLDRKKEALQLAATSDVIVLCMGLSPLLEGEEMDVYVPGFAGGDRTDIALPKIQSDFIKSVMALNKPTVLVLINGSPLAFNWEAENIPAILEAWYPGQAGGRAIADVLFGDYNPAGRLPLTYYKSVKQLPAFDDYSMKGRSYRYFEGEPLYEFGFGLSYTTFEYSNLQMSNEIMADDSLVVSVDVTNTGRLDGEEVVQLYLSHPDNEYAPIRSLQGFKRVFLKKGETKTVVFKLTSSQLSLYHPEYGKVVYAGPVDLYVGGAQPSAERLKNEAVLTGRVKVIGELICQ